MDNENFRAAIRSNRITLEAAAENAGVIVDSDAVAFLIGVLVSPSGHVTAVNAAQAHALFDTVTTHGLIRTQGLILVDDLALNFFRLPYPWNEHKPK